MSQTREKPLHELLSRSMVDIYVGSENTHWILHEKLLCYHSPFFRKIFYNEKSSNSSSKSFGLPDEDDAPFNKFVGWLYSSSLPVPREEKDLGVLFDLYLMAEKWQIPILIQEILHTVREFYKFSDTYPGLRRVQYIYANTEDGSPMRHMLVHSVARLMVLKDGIPQHWDKALRKNGQLAVDIIKAIQDWRLEDEVVPDAREEPADAEDLVDGETVVESNNSSIKDSGSNEPQKAIKDSEPQKAIKQEPGTEDKKMEDAKALPNGITNGDYGTLH